MTLRLLLLSAICAAGVVGGEIRVRGLQQPVEVLRDRWGVPHIYAKTQEDLFFTQGWIAARDRMWQIDTWRRQGNGRLAEVLGPSFVERDRTALLLRYRGDWKQEWASYAPDAWQIVSAFVRGINAYITAPEYKPTAEFRKLGYRPGPWTPNDVVSRMAAFEMMSNLLREVRRAREVDAFGLAQVQKWLPPDPFTPIQIPNELNLKDVLTQSIAAFDEATDALEDVTQGSNNWAIAGRLSATGKPLLASDPHRTLRIPSLRKSVHLVGPGWNVFGAGEPALPGVALGHNERMGFGFTITGIDQQDLYVEQLHPTDGSRYLYKGQWKLLEVERHDIPVKGEAARRVELEYTMHGPVIGKDLARRRLYVMRWIGSEPGTAGYLAGLSLARAHTWNEFQQAAARFRCPSENLVYADVAGNIGFTVAGLAPIRKNWNGLLPVPGHTGEYEWQGFLPPGELPKAYNPRSGFIATANNNILPPKYPHMLQYEWTLPFRAQRIAQQLASRRRWRPEDFESLQQDIVSPTAKRLLAITAKWQPSAGSKASGVLPLFKNWDGRMSRDSVAAAIFELWLSKLGPALVSPPNLGVRARLDVVLDELAAKPQPDLLEKTLNATVDEFEKALGSDRARWRYGNIHFLYLKHPAGEKSFDRGPLPMPGNAHTVNVYTGVGFRASHGASFRMILDTANWDRSRMTNSPGESGDPESPHYGDLLEDWAAGKYHPMPFTRKAVEAATTEKILLSPAS